MKKILGILAVLITTGCTTVKYNGTDAYVKQVDYPETGKIITVYIGDYLVQKGTISEEDILIVHRRIDGVLYDIPAKKYPQIGFDDKNDFLFCCRCCSWWLV